MDEETICYKAIDSVNRSQVAFSKFITANDAGVTGAHQSGFHLHKNSYSLFFERPGRKGSNRDLFVKIKWQDDFETESRFIYYGVGTRDEYRLTRFGREFPFLSEDNVGSLLVICRVDKKYYEAFVLSTDDDIETFFSAFGISPNETNRLIPKSNVIDTEDALKKLFTEYITSISTEFPPTEDLASNARRIIIKLRNLSSKEIKANPDVEILRWLDTEYQLFKAIENDRYSDIITTKFKDVDDFIQTANTILNRRKSRAGKSLEHHLSNMFTEFKIRFTGQPRTEGKKRPDFIFPGESEYHDESFPAENLVFLGAKTTCKDRWRQVINEADRIKTKHLFTLQQGISSNQLKEMNENNVRLVVPQEYITTYPLEHRNEILSLKSFILFVQNGKT